MPLIENLLFPLQNCEATAVSLCRALNVPVTKGALVSALLEHPDYPSLLAVSDVLKNYGIDNLSMRLTEPKKLLSLPIPFVVQIKEKDTPTQFAVVYSITSDSVEWQHPQSRKKEVIPYEKFQEFFTGYVQLYEVSSTAGEKDYSVNLKKEKTNRLINNLLVLAIPVCTLLIAVIAFMQHGIAALFPVIYTVIVLAGVVAGAMLVLYEVDQYNPTLQKVCTGGEKTNCAAILHSKGSKIFGIHWSVIGFSYFMGVLVVLLTGGLLHLHHPLFTAAAWLNVFVLPYTVYSIYYQGRIAKQWCPMCLMVQAVLILLFLTSLVGGLLSATLFSGFSLVPFIISIGVVFLAVYLLIPALEKAKAAKHYQHKLQQLKHNPDIFEALLLRQKKIMESTEGLGITLGNPNGKIHLIKVCNPYCGPCAQAHSIIDELVAGNPEIKLQIIFTATETDGDFRNKPVKAFLALQQHKSFMMEKVLDRWYLSGDKDYEVFVQNYALTEEELTAQIPAIKSMREWCDKTQIEYTPTFFVNNHQLPDLYSVADLRYFLSV